MAEAAVKTAKPAASTADANVAEAERELTDGFHLVIDALKLNGLNTIYGVPGIPITDFGRMAQAAGKKMESGKGMMKAASALSWTGIPRLVAAHTDSPTIPVQAKLAEDAYLSLSLGSALQELDSLDATFAAAGQLRDLGDRPIVVLTAMKPYPAAMLKAVQMTTEQGQRMQAAWKDMHDDEASWSHHSRHELVPDATHYIQFDRPDVVIAAVREAVTDVRSGSAAGVAPVAREP